MPNSFFTNNAIISFDVDPSGIVTLIPSRYISPETNFSIISIEAVLEPSNTDYLYFVASIDGGNVYSKTYEEHKTNVNKYRKDRDERNKALEEASKENN